MKASSLAVLHQDVPILRLFKARAKAGREAELASKLATASVQLISGQPALMDYLAAGPASPGARDFVFMTIWKDFEGVKTLGGEHWARSILPPGYSELIESCSVEHFQLTDRLKR